MQMKGRGIVKIRENICTRHLNIDPDLLSEHRNMEQEASLLTLQSRRMQHVAGRIKNAGRFDFSTDLRGAVPQVKTSVRSPTVVQHPTTCNNRTMKTSSR